MALSSSNSFHDDDDDAESNQELEYESECYTPAAVVSPGVHLLMQEIGFFVGLQQTTTPTTPCSTFDESIDRKNSHPSCDT